MAYDFDSAIHPLQAAGLDPGDPRSLAMFRKLSGGGVGTPTPENPAAPATAAPSGTASIAPARVSPSPAPAAVSPSGEASNPYFEQGQAGELRLAKAAEDRITSLPATDTASDALRARYNQVANPINPYDERGKVLPEYRPSVGQRILRGLRQGPLRADYGAPNPTYQHQEAARQMQEKGLGNQLAQSQAAFKESNDRTKALAQEQRFTGQEYGNVAKNETAEEAAQNKSALEQAQVDLAESRAENVGKKAPTNYIELVQAAQGEKDPNGPLHKAMKEAESHERSLQPNPGHTLSDNELWRSAFVREYKREPSAEEIASKHVAGGGTAGGSAARPNVPARGQSREAFEMHWGKRLGPGSAVEKKYDAQRNSVTKDGTLNDDQKKTEYQRIEAERESEKQNLQSEKDTEAAQYGVYNQPQTPAGPAPGAATPPSTPKPATAAPAQNPPPANQPQPPSKANAAKQATSIRRNPQTKEQAYLIGGKWYRDSELK